MKKTKPVQWPEYLEYEGKRNAYLIEVLSLGRPSVILVVNFLLNITTVGPSTLQWL